MIRPVPTSKEAFSSSARALSPQSPLLSVCAPPQAILKTSIGQVSLFPLYLGSALMALQLLEGKTVEAATAKLRESFVSTYLIGTLFWPAANVASECRRCGWGQVRG